MYLSKLNTYIDLSILYIGLFIPSIMSLGPGEQEVRKLQSTGGSTFTLSLPKPWVTEHNLGSRDSLRVDWRPSGALRITPLTSSNEQERHAFFDHSNLPKNSLHDHLMGAYISGADVIKIRFTSGRSKELARSVRRFLKSTRGFEIINESDDMMEMRCLLNASEMPLSASLNRMYLLVTSLMRDIVNSFDGGELEFLEDSGERESEVDALLYLIDRQVRILLDSHAVAAKLNITRPMAVEYGNLARSLERMMDHVHNLSRFILENPDFITASDDFPPMLHVSTWMNALKELMINIRTRDSVRIEHARHELKSMQQSLLEYEREELEKTSKGPLLAQKLSISESIRRLGAYSRDFGEILLNMKISTEMNVVQNG